MPAAAKDESKSTAASGDLVTNGKGGKNASANLASTDGPSNTIAELDTKLSSFFTKKMRNLEKRKVRLLEIKALEDKGQQLEADQKVAVKKLDSVVEMIDLLKDIGKSVSEELLSFGKQQKKQQKREAYEKQVERNQQESERIKLWLNAQFILARLGSAKSDLLQGENGALKLEKEKVDALEKLVEVLSPKDVDAIESSAEKVNHFLEGNKREFSTGVSYSVLKETIGKLVESKYFDTIAPVSAESIIPVTKNTSVISSIDKEETVPLAKVSESVSIPVDQRVPPVNKSEIAAKVEQLQKPTVQPQLQQQQPNNMHLNQLCFVRDTVVDNELLGHKDPAVVAVASSNFPYQPQIAQGGLPVTTGPNIVPPSTISNQHFAPHMYSAVPTQTFTNPSYTALIPGTNQYIPVSMPGQIPHPMQMAEQNMPQMRNNGQGFISPIPTNEKIVDQVTSDKQQPQFSNEGASHKDASNLHPSQDGGEGKPIVNGNGENGHPNGHFKRNHRGGGPRGGGGNPRGNYGGNPNGGNFRGGRGGKSYNNSNNYYNGGNNGNNVANNGNNGNAPNGNYAPRPINRQNGGGPGGNRPPGQFRHGGSGGPRNNPNFSNNNTNNQQQPASVSAK